MPENRHRRSPQNRPASPQTAVRLDGGPLLPRDLARVARDAAPVRLAPAAVHAVAASRERLERATRDGQPHYGVNTGFGSLARVRVPDQQLADLQRNLIRSHAAGVGDPLPDDVVRGMMLALAASLARGRSGVRPAVVRTIIDCLNHRLTPLVPEVGSVGASGDLAPLAHVAFALIGEGHFRTPDGRTHPAARILRQHGLTPLELQAKEGLALINGTHLMAARAALLLHDLDRLFNAALAAAAMSIDACRATDQFLSPHAADLRRHAGTAAVAQRLRALLTGSTIIPSHRDDDPRVQDPYSLRCMPQVLGAVHDAIERFRPAVLAELDAVTDNPLILPDGSLVSAGNFHGMPIALPLDQITPAIAHLAGISERRSFLILAAADPEAHLRPYLSPHPGVSSGLMIAQYAAAACCNEIIALAAPASVANLSTCAGMEDYNSFGPRAAAKADRALRLARYVVAVELLCAAQAIEFHRPLRSGRAVERAHAFIRQAVPPLTKDRPPAADTEAIAALIASGHFDTL
ncbi:MAG: histidine ammonia-lyase [Phycisphaeraceae bacterium]|nr:MAG: histidine ammonia-lyase [Phycisphaeraceae bacterium]